MKMVDKKTKIRSVSDLSRRKLIKTAGVASVLAASGIAFPAITGFAKEFSGVTLQGASFSSTFFKYLKNYF
mgnify:FL=1